MEKKIPTDYLTEISNQIRLKNFNLAEKYIRNLQINLDKKNSTEYQIYVKVTIILIDLLLNSSKNLIALEELNSVIKQFPYEEKFLRKMYKFSFKTKRVQTAEDNLRKLIKLKPEEIGLRLQLIKILIDKNENLSAIIELKRIIAMDLISQEIFKLLISLLGKEKMYSEQLKQIRKISELLPKDDFWVLEEVRALNNLGKKQEAFELIYSYLNYLIDNESLDKEFYELLEEFTELFICTGNRDLLIEIFIFSLPIQNEKVDDKIKSIIEKFAVRLKLQFIYNYQFQSENEQEEMYEKLISAGKISNYDLIEEIILLTQKSNRSRSELREYLKNKKIGKLIANDFLFFIESLLNIEELEVV